MAWADWIATVLAAYAGVGLIFGLIFIVRGVGRVDEAARDSGLGFRLVILPGAAALWPLIWRLWSQKGTPS